MIENYEYEGIKVKAYKPKRADQVLLCLHGFAGDKESSVIDAVGNSLLDENILTITFDWPCHGEDENHSILSLELCFKYLETMLEHIKSKFNLPVSVFATSFGAYLLLHYLSHANENLNKIILRCPAVDMGRIIFKIFNEHGYAANDIETETLNLGYGRELLIDKRFVYGLKLPEFKQNDYYLNIIQGKKDDLIDCKFNEKYFKKYFGKNHKIFYFKNADHRFKNPGEKEKIVEIVKEIIKH